MAFLQCSVPPQWNHTCYGHSGTQRRTSWQFIEPNSINGVLSSNDQVKFLSFLVTRGLLSDAHHQAPAVAKVLTAILDVGTHHAHTRDKAAVLVLLRVWHFNMHGFSGRRACSACALNPCYPFCLSWACRITNDRLAAIAQCSALLCMPRPSTHPIAVCTRDNTA